ncbi:hypothetical protein DV736_g6351, partial [Chaetothyriales sp. CBS 134916]
MTSSVASVDSLFSAIETRRTIYPLTKTSTVPDSRIREIVESTIKHTPSAFNVQSARAVILLGADHEKLWEKGSVFLQKSVPAEVWEKFAPRVQGFKAAYGTALWFEDSEDLDDLKEKNPQVQHVISEWSDHSSGMHHFIAWTALSLEGLGCNLQHYNLLPGFTKEVLEEWKLPQTWVLKSQLVFGKPINGMVRDRDRTYKPVEDRMSLLVTIFIIELICYLVLSIGAKPINDSVRLSTIDVKADSRLIPPHQLWQIYNRTPLASSKDFQDQVRLRQDVVRMKRELAGISAQDDFAKWAKLRRQHDKAMEEYDKKAAALSASRSSFDIKATAIRWTCTRGLQIALQFWHTKTPIFTYPRGWFPWQIEWILGFPRCPYGGVSINVWSNTCSVVIALVGELVGYALKYVQEVRSRRPQKTKQPQKTKAN